MRYWERAKSVSESAIEIGGDLRTVSRWPRRPTNCSLCGAVAIIIINDSDAADNTNNNNAVYPCSLIFALTAFVVQNLAGDGGDESRLRVHYVKRWQRRILQWGLCKQPLNHLFCVIVLSPTNVNDWTRRE